MGWPGHGPAFLYYLTPTQLAAETGQALVVLAERTGAHGPGLPMVQSPRGRGYLRLLRPALARRARSVIVREFLPELDAAFSTA